MSRVAWGPVSVSTGSEPDRKGLALFSGPHSLSSSGLMANGLTVLKDVSVLSCPVSTGGVFVPCDVISHFISRSVWLMSTQRPCVAGATIRVRPKKDVMRTKVGPSRGS